MKMLHKDSAWKNVSSKIGNQSVLQGEQGTWFSQSPLLTNIKWGLLSSCHTGIAISGPWGRRIKNEITFTYGHRGPWCSTTQAIPLGLDENRMNDTALRRNVWENVCFILLRSFLIFSVHASLIKLHMWFSSLPFPLCSTVQTYRLNVPIIKERLQLLMVIIKEKSLKTKQNTTF